MQISIPIFSGFSKTNQVRSVRNQIAQLDLQRGYAEEGVVLQIRQSINNLLTSRETMLSNEMTVDQAQKAYDISLTRYDAQSIYDYLSARAEYDRVAGNDEYANRE